MAANDDDKSMDFYCGSGSPYAWKVWLALEHKALPYRLRMMSFDAGDLDRPDFAAINPRRKVPAIVDGGLALYESAAIVEYLEDAYPQSGAPLWPRTVHGRARARRVAAEAQNELYPVMRQLIDAILYQPDGQADQAAADRGKAALAKELDLLAPAIAGPFVTGSGASAADFTIYPMMAFVGRIDLRRPGHDLRALLPEGVRAWMTAVEALPYFARTWPPHWKG